MSADQATVDDTMTPAAFDQRELRNVLGAFVTGVAIITTVDKDGTRHGLTVNSFSSVSLDPPLVLWSQSLKAPSHPVFRDAGRFAVNVLAESQHEISNAFAKAGADKFSTCTYSSGLGGVPLIDGSVAFIECRKEQNLPGGDHMVFLGRVERIKRNPLPPLVFGGGRYLVAQPHELGVAGEARPYVPSQLLVRDANRVALELSRDLDETVGVAVWGNHGPTIVQWAPRGEPFTDNTRAGLVVPLLSTATGLAFASWLPHELTAELIAAESIPIANVADLSDRTTAIRHAGIARVTGVQRDGDLTAVTSFSVPVFDKAGRMLLALTAAGPSHRLDDAHCERIVQRLRQCAEALRDRLPGN